MINFKKGQTVTHRKDGRKGKYIRKDRRNLSIDLVLVQWEGNDFESRISPTLLLEGTWEYYVQSLEMAEVA